jgi:hypothetical protein
MTSMLPEAISWGTPAAMKQTRCACVGWVQTGRIRPASIVVRDNQWLASSK